ncbi:DNA-binding response regulator [Kangiella profundi]|uniref:DNA-binding response regulator n=1 Tax=Kangiella profundi TaxID=1561924 RepID=A0A2K9B0K2_9GAMM|nr:response regulator transcription factor [Kangiella profundi]AUD78458.1 DNA-binding response regulator [Kangiella profundi]GGF08084.1 DNA-binding response regulator [Kangiella profundi]
MIEHCKPLKLLLIEDHRDLAKNIGDFFEQLGYIMDFAETGTRGINLSLSNYYDVIILDLMLPGMDGLQVCQQLRHEAKRHIPVLMLTARDTLQDKVTGFQHGADDYLTKPFALEELHMRCLALSKRNQLHKSHIITLGELTIDTQQQLVTRQNIPIELNTMSYRILVLLAEAHPRVVTRSELSEKLWGDDITESDSLRSHIYYLRQALDKPFEKALIRTVHGVGFALNH